MLGEKWCVVGVMDCSRVDKKMRERKFLYSILLCRLYITLY